MAPSKSEGATERYLRLSAAPKPKASPLNVPGVKVKTQDLVAMVREERDRPRR